MSNWISLTPAHDWSTWSEPRQTWRCLDVIEVEIQTSTLWNIFYTIWFITLILLFVCFFERAFHIDINITNINLPKHAFLAQFRWIHTLSPSALCWRQWDSARNRNHITALQPQLYMLNGIWRKWITAIHWISQLKYKGVVQERQHAFVFLFFIIVN